MADPSPLANNPSVVVAPAATDPLIGTRLNNIELVRRLDEGGMGTIYLGVNRELDKEYAVKVASPEADPALEGRALREAKALSQLDHPNIIQVFDAWTLDDGRLAIVMPLLSGSSLLWHVARLPAEAGHRLPVRDAVHIALQLARGLDEAHRHGFVHRDLKPGNVFVTQRETELEGVRGPEVKLLDFGLVRVSQSTWQPLDPNSAVPVGGPAPTIAGGTPEYVSPEQVTGNPDIDGRADLYSLGVLLFELLTGRLPFVAPSGLELREQVIWLVRQHLREPSPRVSVWAPQVPRPLEDLIAQLLEKAPKARPQSAKVVEEHLREILRALPRGAAAPAPLSLPLPRPPARTRTVAAAVVALAALGGLAWFGLGQPPAPQAPVAPAPAPLDPPPVAPPDPPAPPPVAPATVVEAPPPPPRPAPPPRKPTPKRVAKARVAPAAACTPDERWRERMLGDLKDLGRLAQDDSQRFARFKKLEVRLSPLVRSASSPDECAQAGRLLEELRSAISP